MDAIGPDEHVAFDWRPVLELRGDAVIVLRKAGTAPAKVECGRRDVLDEPPLQRGPMDGDDKR